MKRPIPFGKYMLLERINVGGMAEIFLARSRGLQGFKRILAIKKILPTMAEDEDFIAMFIDEARIAAELSHTGIVQIHELGKFEEDYYIAMEFVHGKDLRYTQERMARDSRHIPFELTALIGFRICEALDYAHIKRDPSGRPLGIIHRDISPQNVILSFDGEVKICDFGIAKATNRSQKTQAGVLKGKFGYMSPEQVRGLPLDGRSDIFTVGTLLYEMVTVERLFMGESDFSTLEKVRNADVVPPSHYNPDLPEELENIILRALAKEVEDRFQSAAEMGETLHEYMIRSSMASSRDIAAFIRETFQQEFEAEMNRLEFYQKMTDEELRELSSQEDPVDDSVSPLHVPEDEDVDAKTLIFASSEHPVIQQSPADPAGVSPAAGPGSNLASLRTMIFPEKQIQPDITDAKTQIFAGQEDPVSSSETVVGPVTAVPKEEATGQVQTRNTVQAPGRFAGWLLSMTLVAAVLLIWAVVVTFKLVQTPDPAGLYLQVHPADELKILLDGKPVANRTPYLDPRLASGHYLLRVSRAGFRDLIKEIEIEPGNRLHLEVYLQKMEAGLTRRLESVLRQADADLNGNDSVKSAAPLANNTAENGSISSGDEPKLATMVPARSTPRSGPAILTVDSRPTAANVSIDGVLAGKTPFRTDALPPGKEVKVSTHLPGYRRAHKTIRLLPGVVNRVDLPLVKRNKTSRKADNRTAELRRDGFGFLLANTQPWSKVYVDGSYTGQETPISPDKKLKLTAGKHRVTFETPGGKRHSFEVDIEPNKTIKLIKRFD